MINRRLAAPLQLLGALAVCGTFAMPACAATQVTLPDDGAYAYWVQSTSGSVVILPKDVSGEQEIALPSRAMGGTLYVLDDHTGEIASVPVAKAPLAIRVSDFVAVSGAPSAESASPSVPTAPTKATAAAPSSAPPAQGGVPHLLTTLFGFAIAAGVVWVIWTIVQSRGRPLIDAARRFGVDVPDPSGLSDDDPPEPVYSPPVRRVVEAIPDAAGLAPATGFSVHGRAAAGTLGEPQIVGIQGVAAGSVFVVSIGETFIGREGDNGIVLADTTVSRKHARLVRTADGTVTVSDAGSANGILVNGRRLTESALTSGDQIQIGDNHFRFEQ